MDREILYNYLMLGGILLILISPLFVIPTYLEAKHFCSSINQTYSFDWLGNHYCNKEAIIKYFPPLKQKPFWNFKDAFNLVLTKG
jgi:hypothetical protein